MTFVFLFRFQEFKIQFCVERLRYQFHAFYVVSSMCICVMHLEKLQCEESREKKRKTVELVCGHEVCDHQKARDHTLDLYHEFFCNNLIFLEFDWPKTLRIALMIGMKLMSNWLIMPLWRRSRAANFSTWKSSSVWNQPLLPIWPFVSVVFLFLLLFLLIIDLTSCKMKHLQC